MSRKAVTGSIKPYTHKSIYIANEYAEVWDRAQKEADEQGISLSTWISEGIAKNLSGGEDADARARRLARAVLSRKIA